MQGNYSCRCADGNLYCFTRAGIDRIVLKHIQIASIDEEKLKRAWEAARKHQIQFSFQCDTHAAHVEIPLSNREGEIAMSALSMRDTACNLFIKFQAYVNRYTYRLESKLEFSPKNVPDYGNNLINFDAASLFWHMEQIRIYLEEKYGISIEMEESQIKGGSIMQSIYMVFHVFDIRVLSHGRESWTGIHDALCRNTFQRRLPLTEPWSVRQQDGCGAAPERPERINESVPARPGEKRATMFDYKRLYVTEDELALARNKGMKDPRVPSYPKGRMRFLAEDGTTAATVVYAARPAEVFEDCGTVLGVTVMVPGKGTVSGVVYTAGHFVRFFREGSDPLGWKNRDCHERVVLDSFLLALAYRLSQLEETEPNVRPIPHHGEIVSVDAVDPAMLMATEDADLPEPETDYLADRKPSEACGRFQGVRSWSPKKDGWWVEAHKRRLSSGKEVWVKGHWARRQTWKKIVRSF